MSTDYSFAQEPSDELQFFHKLVDRLNNKIRGTEVGYNIMTNISVYLLAQTIIYGVFIIQAAVSELWYVEEYDLLALALEGRMKVRRFQLGCYVS